VTDSESGRLHRLRSEPYVAVFPEDQVEEQLAKLRQDPRVLAATRNWRVSPEGGPAVGWSGGALATDVLKFLNSAGWLPSDDGSQGAQTVHVGILDSGVNNDAVTTGALDDRQLDSCALGAAMTSTPYDHSGHGSVIAAIIDQLGIDAHIHSIRCFGRGGAVLSDIVYGMLLARLGDDPIDVFNMSFSVSASVTMCPNCQHRWMSRNDQIALDSLFGYLRDELDDRPILIAAAGNAGRTVSAPASSRDVIAVGSTGASPASDPLPEPDYRSLPADFILAPGGARTTPVAKTRPGGNEFFGTSFATAVVSGVVARLLRDPAAHDIPSGRDDARRVALIAELRRRAYRGFRGYKSAIHGMGVLGGIPPRV